MATTVYKSGSTYYARLFDDSILTSGTVFETVYQEALDNRGTIHLANNNNDAAGRTWFSCSSEFTGFTIPNEVTIMGDFGSWIIPPSTSSGNVFLISGSNNEATHIKGLTIVDLARSWTGIKVLMDSESDNLQYDIFRDITMYYPNTGISLESSNNGWINSNYFEDIVIFYPIIGVLFNRQSSIEHNSFKNVNVEGLAGITTHGFKDVSGRGNVFQNCSVWDLASTDIDMNITSGATDTCIIGGRLGIGDGLFIDQGVNTYPKKEYNVRKTSDQTNIGTSFTNVTDLGVSLLADNTYEFEFNLIADAYSSSTGIDVAVNGPSGTINYTQNYWTGSSSLSHKTATSYDKNSSSSGSAGTIKSIYTIKGILSTTAAGTLIPRVKRENNGGGSVNIRAGSWGMVRRIS